METTNPRAAYFGVTLSAQGDPEVQPGSAHFFIAHHAEFIQGKDDLDDFLAAFALD